MSELHPWIEKIVFSQQDIENKISQELAPWVNETYKDSKHLVLIGLLKGSIPFLAQLIKYINIDHTLDFMIASSYEGNYNSSGSVKIIMDLNQDIKDKDVLIVEDIIDSGITLEKISNLLQTRGPKTLKILTLLDKPNHRKNKNIKPDKTGFIAPDEFLVGFGMDYKEKLRNLPYIGIFRKKFTK